ncbi:MAG TPA: hypothetical protein VFV50_09250 [Bdellovibrionales bacterium]|nr:hypothetical protein [Bdellovibrionales bacterium]
MTTRRAHTAGLFGAIALAVILLLPLNARAELFFYAGAGTAVQFPGTIRAGYGSWEGGLLTTGAVGADQLFRLDHGFYAAFGPAAVFSEPVGLGFYGAFGGEWGLFWGLTLRTEMNAVAAHNGFARGELNAGLGLHF